MRTRAERRHRNVCKALRKQHMAKDFYDNLHQYSKNKIHCSCPQCRGKIKNKEISGPTECWPMQDQKQFVDMDQQMDELYQEQ